MIRIPLLLLSILMFICISLPAQAQTPQRDIHKFEVKDREHLACIQLFYFSGQAELGGKYCDELFSPDKKKKNQKNK